jgi:dipeptidyl aminopeptidase/acylaminoacyl peptidase
MRLSIPRARQLLLHGTLDDTVPADFSRRYVEIKKKSHEDVRLVEIPKADHYDLIDPRSTAWEEVEAAVSGLLAARM